MVHDWVGVGEEEEGGGGKYFGDDNEDDDDQYTLCVCACVRMCLNLYTALN